jgi:hypothetical protein
MCEPREKRLLAATGMMEAFHHEQFPHSIDFSGNAPGPSRWS